MLCPIHEGKAFIRMQKDTQNSIHPVCVTLAPEAKQKSGSLNKSQYIIKIYPSQNLNIEAASGEYMPQVLTKKWVMKYLAEKCFQSFIVIGVLAYSKCLW